MTPNSLRAENIGCRLCLVTPSLNGAAYLESAIQSVVHQEGFNRVDYVLMDGGSRDGSQEIIAKYAEFISYSESKADKGLYHAAEEGFNKSDAEIMGWLNADDKLCPWTIQLVLRIFDQLPEVSFITSGMPLIMDSQGVVYRADLLPGVTRRDFLSGLNLPNQGWPATNFISQESTFWRRSLWDRAGGGFDHSLKLACDFELWARFLEFEKLHVVDSPMAMFRPHGTNLSILSRDEYAREARGVLSKHGFLDGPNKSELSARVRRLFLEYKELVADPLELERPTFISYDEASKKHIAGPRWLPEQDHGVEKSARSSVLQKLSRFLLGSKVERSRNTTPIA